MALVALGVIALLTLVSYASRGSISTRTQTTTPGYVSYALTLFLILFVIAVPVAVWAFLQQAREIGGKHKSFLARMVSSLSKVALVFGIAALFVYLRKHGRGLFNPALQHLTSGGHARTHGKLVNSYQPHFEWIVLWIALVVFACAAVAIVVVARRRREELAAVVDESTIAEDVAVSIGEAISDLESEPDARRAVIAAYARMEHAFARHGLHRRPSETPVEYLRRLLLGVSSQATAIGRLTDLFELAKFSRHEIDASMKEDAIAALRTIRDDLQGAVA